MYTYYLCIGVSVAFMVFIDIPQFKRINNNNFGEKNVHLLVMFLYNIILIHVYMAVDQVKIA